MAVVAANEIRNIPRYGEHTECLLTSLGYSSQEVAKLRETGAC